MTTPTKSTSKKTQSEPLKKSKDLLIKRPFKVFHQFDSTYQGNSGDINDEPSCTIPDMNLTIKQLLTNHTRGIHSSIHDYSTDARYSDIEIPQFTDITQFDQWKRDNDARLKDLEAQIKAERLALVRKEAAEKIRQQSALEQQKKTEDNAKS